MRQQNSLSPQDETMIASLALAAIAIAVMANTVFWLAGNTAAVTQNKPTVGYSFLLFIDAYKTSTAAIWPQVNNIAVWVIIFAALAIAAAAFSVHYAQKIYRNVQRKGKSLENELEGFNKTQRAKQAKDLRPVTLEATDQRLVAEKDVGSPIGTLNGEKIYSSWEDVEIAIMAPRSGKTSALAIPKILAAPGNAIITSNKGDLYDYTFIQKSRTTRCHVFDPMAIISGECDWYWDPITAVDDFDDALALAGEFIKVSDQKTSSGNSKFFEEQARKWLAYLFLAASKAAGPPLTLHEVALWTTQDRPEQALARLERTHKTQHKAFNSLISGANETVQGIKSSVDAGAVCFQSSKIMRWVTPSAGKKRFDIQQFLSNDRYDTLYLFSDETKAIAASPLIAAFVNTIFSQAAIKAAKSKNRRLDPPLVTILDEAANICTIDQLPRMYSHFGSRGMFVCTILQNEAQAKNVWGDKAWQQMWSAATIKIFGAGIDDIQTAETLSKFSGEEEEKTVSISTNSQGKSQSTSQRKKRVLDPSEIRSLGKNEGLLMVTGQPLKKIRFLPWHENKKLSKQLNADSVTLHTEKQLESSAT